MVAEGPGWGCEFDMSQQGGFSEDIENTVQGGRILKFRLSGGVVGEVTWGSSLKSVCRDCASWAYHTSFGVGQSKPLLRCLLFSSWEHNTDGKYSFKCLLAM